MLVCQQWVKRATLRPGTRGGLGKGRHPHIHAVAHTNICQHISLACMKRVFRPMVPLQAQLWSVTLLGENISFTLWCLFCYKKASPSLKIDPLVWNSGRMELTLSGPQMLKTTFIFHSGHVTTCYSLTLMKTLSAATAFKQLNALRKHRKKRNGWFSVSADTWCFSRAHCSRHVSRFYQPHTACCCMYSEVVVSGVHHKNIVLFLL